MKTIRDFETKLRDELGFSNREAKRLASGGWSAFARDEQGTDNSCISHIEELTQKSTNTKKEPIDMKSIQALREKRDQIAKDLHALMNEREGKNWTPENQTEYDAAMKQLSDVNNAIEKINQQHELLANSYKASMGVFDTNNCVEVYQDSQSGKNIPVLGPQHKLAAHAFGDRYKDDSGMRHHSIGSYLKALAVGTNDQSLRNALEEGTSSAGGVTVPDHILREAFDLARAKNHMIKAGMRTIMLDTQQTGIAKLASDPVAGWRTENAAVAESDPTFEGITLQARSLAVLVKASVELLQDSLNAEEMLNMAFAGAMAAEIDRVGLLGSGTAPEPRGILNTTGVNVYNMGTDGAALNGFTNVLAAYQLMAEANSAEATGLIMSPRERFAYAGMVDTTGQPLNKPDLLEEVPFLMTSKVPVNGTHGAAENAANMYLGDFSKAILGLRSQMRIEVLKERFMDNLQIGFVCHMRADIALAYPDHFTVIKGVIPAS